MYESFFHLARRPFLCTPQVERYFPACEIEEARLTLTRTVERAEGPGLLIGPAGTGKTLVCHLLAAQFRNRFRIVYLTSGRLGTVRGLLQAVLFELGLPYRKLDEGELRLSLIGYLTRGQEAEEGMLLVADEADALSPRLLEELRLMTNLVRNGQTQVRLVLAGGAALEERFAHPKLESFSQRLAARCYLSSWNGEQTGEFVRRQIAAAGGKPERIFTPAALSAIYQATDGIPRLIVQLCDHALTLAFAGGRNLVDADGIEEAWSDLQQLPAPWNNPSRDELAATTPTESVIEFGSLEDDEVPARPENSPPVAAVAQPSSATQAPLSPEPATFEIEEEPLVETVRDVARMEEDLAEFAQQLEEQLREEGEDADHEDVMAATPLRIHQVDFSDDDDDYADEEIVIDHYAALEANMGTARVRPRDGEDRQLSNFLAGDLIQETTRDPQQRATVGSISTASLSATTIAGSTLREGEELALKSPQNSQSGSSYVESVTDSNNSADSTGAEPSRFDSLTLAEELSDDISFSASTELASETTGIRLDELDAVHVEPADADICFEEQLAATSERGLHGIQRSLPRGEAQDPVEPEVDDLELLLSQPVDEVLPPEVACELEESLRALKPCTIEVGDGDLIVIEDEAQSPTTSGPRGRRQDYRQLFAKLRRG